VTADRTYPDRPFLAASAAIVHDGKVLIVRRGRPPAEGVYTLPGGVVEAGETVMEAAAREVLEETSLVVEPVALAGHREAIARDAEGRVRRHFVILCFASRYISGTPVANEEISEVLWLDPAAIERLPTTEGLAEIVASAAALLKTT
jgi:ADP-ribose pyrophosphatase YjhB (NUDIX family)